MSEPPLLWSCEDYQRAAHAALADRPAALAWLDGGAGHEACLRRNVAAYTRWSIWPRVLRRLAHGHLRTSVCGIALDHPLLVAPMGHLRLLHDSADLGMLRGATAVDATMVVGTWADVALETLAQAVPESRRWFQLYAQPDPGVTVDLLERVATAGYQAVMLTLDTPAQALSRRAQRAGFQPPAGAAANLAGYPAPAPRTLDAGASRIFQGLMAEAPDLAMLARIRAATRLPLLVKGVAHPDDAKRVLDAGIDGIVVSNHGGRALDSARASLDLLRGLRRALGDAPVLLLDGGLRNGSDVFKALALGANAVLLGRPLAWALAAQGALGVARLLSLLRTELELAMALAGCATLADIGPHCVLQEDPAPPCHADPTGG